MSKLYIIIDEKSIDLTESEGDFGDGTVFSGYFVNQLELSIKSLHRTPPTIRFFYRTLETEIDKRLLVEDGLYIGIIRYRSGGTFGRTYGNSLFVCAAKTKKTAQQQLDNCILNGIGRYGYKPWDGYFERLEDSYVEYVKFAED